MFESLDLYLYLYLFYRYLDINLTRIDIIYTRPFWKQSIPYSSHCPLMKWRVLPSLVALKAHKTNLLFILAPIDGECAPSIG